MAQASFQPVNGVTNVNPNSKHNQEDSDSTSDAVNLLINNLRETIVHSIKRPLSRKHRIILVGDRHVRGYVSTLKPLLN
jgi:hypothetical protein